MHTVIEFTELRIGQFAGRIRRAWQMGVESVVETGRLLIEAKRDLPGGFEAMIASDLPFKRDTAYRLMKVADNPVLSDVAHRATLPPSWRTLYELTKLPDDVLRAKLADGTINPSIERRDVATMINKPVEDDHAAAEPHEEPNGDADNRARIATPPGKTVADLCRDAAQLQADGALPEDARKQTGLSERAFREGSMVVRLSDRNDLNAHDAELVRKALAEMNATQRTHKVFKTLKPIADRVWGKGSPRGDRTRALRVEEFQHAITFLVETCARGSEIKIPVLDDEQITDAIKQIGEATTALRQLVTRIKGSRS